MNLLVFFQFYGLIHCGLWRNMLCMGLGARDIPESGSFGVRFPQTLTNTESNDRHIIYIYTSVNKTDRRQLNKVRLFQIFQVLHSCAHTKWHGHAYDWQPFSVRLEDTGYASRRFFIGDTFSQMCGVPDSNGGWDPFSTLHIPDQKMHQEVCEQRCFWSGCSRGRGFWFMRMALWKRGFSATTITIDAMGHFLIPAPWTVKIG